MRKAIRLLSATTALTAVAGMAMAGNYINIDEGAVSDGSVTSLSITQDAAKPSNNVSGGTAGSTAFTVRGQWDTISISQTGQNNSLMGGVKVSNANTTNTVRASYTNNATGIGTNTHTLNIGGTTAPLLATVDVTVVNTATPADTSNAITDTIDASGTVAYKLNVNGTNNTLTNTVAGADVTLYGASGGSSALAIAGDSNIMTNNVQTAGNIVLGQTITGSSNTVVNQGATVSDPFGNAAGGLVTETISVTGDSNVITNKSSGTGTKTISVTLNSSGNTVTNNFGATDGANSSTLIADGGTRVNYLLDASGAGGDTTAITTLNGVIGVSSAAVPVTVTQSAAGVSSNLTVNGNGFTAGSAGVTVTQASAGATLTQTVNGAAIGYTVNISQ